jgi:hypothetical protein
VPTGSSEEGFMASGVVRARLWEVEASKRAVVDFKGVDVGDDEEKSIRTADESDWVKWSATGDEGEEQLEGENERRERPYQKPCGG